MDAYEVLEKLGSGSFGTIRRVIRKADRKILVWKEIRYGRMNEKEKSMLVSEVNILRELKHPNIVRYKDRIIDRESATIFIVMEYCENGDLASVIRKYKRSGKRLDESKVWSIFFQLVCALHECHCRKDKILHRDIKPANVFIDRHHNFKLGDFGLARVLSGAENQFAQTNVGTPYYMAPEQVNEVPYNEKCDIWSLGCLIYELAALAPPFEANNQLALAVKIKAGRVARLPDSFSEELSGVVRSMLQVDTAKRPSVEDLLRLPRLQEEAEMVMRNATAVPPVYLDRYFATQMKRLAGKEEELNARALELAAREKELGRERPASGSGGAAGVAAAAAEADRREAEVQQRETEARRRERAASDGLVVVEEREKVVTDKELAAARREAELLERVRVLEERERSVGDRERRVEKAKQEYNAVFTELKRKKRALDEQQRLLAAAAATAAGLGPPSAARGSAEAAAGQILPPLSLPTSNPAGGASAGVSPAASVELRPTPPSGVNPPLAEAAAPVAALSGGGSAPDAAEAAPQRTGSGVVTPPVPPPSNAPRRESFGYGARRAASFPSAALPEDIPAPLVRHRPSYPPSAPHRPAATEADPVPASAAARGDEGRTREVLRCEAAAPRSPTPHPRQGFLFEKEREQQQQQPGRNNNGPQRKLTVDAKRQAIYGTLFNRKPGKGDSDSDDDTAPILPTNLNTRRMFAMPSTEELDSSMD